MGATLSLLLIILWIMSGWYVLGAKVWIATGPHEATDWRVDFVWGQIRVTQFWVEAEDPRTLTGFGAHVNSLKNDFGLSAPEWTWMKWGYFSVQRSRWAYFPLWAPFLLIAAPTVWSFYRNSVGKRRSAAGACPACGYDLRGNRSGRCPECGAMLDATTPRG